MTVLNLSYCLPRMESPPLYRAPPAPSRRPPGASDGNLASTNDSDDIYEQLPSGGDSDGGGSEDALVKPSWIRNQRQQQQQQGPKPKLEPSASDNCVMKDFDNLWSGARRSQRDLGGTGVPNAKSQQPYLAFGKQFILLVQMYIRNLSSNNMHYYFSNWEAKSSF